MALPFFYVRRASETQYDALGSQDAANRFCMSSPPPDDEDDDDDDRRWNFLLALAGVILIVAIGFFLVWKMWQNEKLQECVLTGRRDCAPIDVPSSH